MPTNYTGRVILILTVMLGAFWAIFPAPQKLFRKDVPFSEALNLKPGIDMVGGTSLLYEIKPPEGVTLQNGDLANKVMESLKKRVDPTGVRNLIWRPQGNTRLEIQMPLNAQSADAGAKREAFAVAREELEQTNIRKGSVLRAVETLHGADRDKELNALAMNSATRQKLFAKMTTTWDQIVDARAKQNAEVQAQKENEYEDLKAQLEATNLPSADFQAVLDAPEAARKPRLEEIQKQSADFPARKQAVEKFQTAYADYNTIKNSIDDAADLKRLLKGSGVLEFHILAEDMSSPAAQAMVARLSEKGAGPRPQANDTMRWYEVDRADEFKGRTITYLGKHYVLASTEADKSMVHKEGTKEWSLQDAYPAQTENGGKAVGFSFDAQGAALFSDLTGRNIRRPLAIVLDNKIISAPNINSQISRHGIITGGGAGGFSSQELKYLINTLNAGSLPAQLAEEPISERTIQAELGADNLRRGLLGCFAGLVAVAIFMCAYYYLGGLVAAFALLLNMVLILGTLAALNATFTLPAIAALALTIGTSVDANVLVFERLREEQLHGLGLRLAMRNAYDRAFTAIVDSNVTTAITSMFLFMFGTEEVKGFGLTLLIGIVCSLFSALFVTKTIFGIWIDKFGLKTLGSFPLSFPAWDRMLKPKIDWMGLSWIFYTFSAVFIGLGLFLFAQKIRQREMFDIEFAGGTAIQFELKEPIALPEMRKLVQQADPAANPVAVGDKNKVYEVTTPTMDRNKVQNGILRVLEGKLKLEEPSEYDLVGKSAGDALDKAIYPIKDKTASVSGWLPPDIGSYDGGVAIVLDHLNPKLSPAEIKSRIERQRLQAQTDKSASSYREFKVTSESGDKAPTDRAIVMVVDPQLPYSKDSAKWQDELAGPMWKLIDEAVHNPPKLQKVSNFDAQVAGEMQVDALLALTLSSLVIMAYIWMRFGNLTYGTATVAAMLHDALFTLAALGLSHYINESFIAKVLLVEPFRINLTVVAGILTVMSYSMIDTIVVFDRIRENRGKYGHLSRRIINEAINQTLSRTMLTGGTTVATVAIMYFVGGPSIHGFTFVLLLGILVGTYSSIAIASPLLLIGAAKDSEKTGDTTGQQPSGGKLQRAG